MNSEFQTLHFQVNKFYSLVLGLAFHYLKFLWITKQRGNPAAFSHGLFNERNFTPCKCDRINHVRFTFYATLCEARKRETFDAAISNPNHIFFSVVSICYVVRLTKQQIKVWDFHLVLPKTRAISEIFFIVFLRLSREISSCSS